MNAPQWNPATQYYPPVQAPDAEWLGQAFCTPILTPTPVGTKLPSPTALQATLQGFMRIEAGDVSWVREVWGAAWDVTFLMHSYSPNEVQASQNSTTAISYAAAATGTTVAGWFIADVLTVVGGRRLSDPDVPLNVVRYRSAVTWRVAGQPPTKISQ